MDYDNPLTTPYIAWPLLGSMVGMGVLLFCKNPVLKLIQLSFSALIMLVLIIPSLWLGSYTGEDAWIPVLVTSLTLCLFAPLIEAVFGQAFTSSGEVQVSRETIPLDQL
jgi:hypothetical protein